MREKINVLCLNEEMHDLYPTKIQGCTDKNQGFVFE